MQTISIPNFSFGLDTAPFISGKATQSSIAKRAQQAVVEHPNLKGSKIRTRAENGKVTIDGSVQSYFEKQMAQEALRNLDGVLAIENELVVTW